MPQAYKFRIAFNIKGKNTCNHWTVKADNAQDAVDKFWLSHWTWEDRNVIGKKIGLCYWEEDRNNGAGWQPIGTLHFNPCKPISQKES